MSAYYNENDPFAAHWLRNLIAEGLIMDGEVDDRDIQEVEPADLRGFTRCHFFAGIAGWDLALALAGWPDDAPVWTGSCPCQPFSVAGKGEGFDDDRHLWPVWYELIRECRPPAVFGEQVASADGRDWLAAVRSDLENAGYAVGAADLCAAGVGAPHIGQRLYWLAQTNGPGLEGFSRHGDGSRRKEEARSLPSGGGPGGTSGVDPVPDLRGLPLHTPRDARLRVPVPADRGVGHGPLRPWDGAEYLRFDDETRRPVRPGTIPLAPRLPGGVGRLRAYGNSIVPQVAAEFIAAAADSDYRDRR